MIKIGVLTSSRADFGIFIPLLYKLRLENSIYLEIIAFGTHLSEEHGFTLNEIKDHNFPIIHEIKTPVENKSPKDISENISKTILAFSDFWEKNLYNYVVCLGDRYEMFAAIVAASTFGIKIAHIHGGETTLGAIDNMYRHSITLMSSLIFVTTNTYKYKAKAINSECEIFNVGALSIDNLKSIDYYTLDEFNIKFTIDLTIPSILITFHPETIGIEKNEFYIEEIISAIEILKRKYQIIITLPNADTMGDLIREKILKYNALSPEIKVIESFGMKGYLSCMKYCSFMLGNSSSGFVEASYFPKWVINLGDRQKGRIVTNNIINSSITKESILDKVSLIENSKLKNFKSIYGEGNTAEKMVEILMKNAL
jgi:GDP/UDP-N,N'-diacetylbacillosamine 2-epimerase (hydrolysing)